MTFTYKTKNHINTHLNEKVNLDIPLTEKDKAPTYNVYK